MKGVEGRKGLEQGLLRVGKGMMSEKSSASFLTMDSGDFERYDDGIWGAITPEGVPLMEETEDVDLMYMEALEEHLEESLTKEGEGLDVDELKRNGYMEEDQALTKVEVMITEEQYTVGNSSSMSLTGSKQYPSPEPALTVVTTNGNDLDRMYKKKLREAARLRLQRKRQERKMNSQGWTYAGRKRIANARPRVNGRFVKRESPKL